jgi:hypothetical protein
MNKLNHRIKEYKQENKCKLQELGSQGGLTSKSKFSKSHLYAKSKNVIGSFNIRNGKLKFCKV